MHAWRMSELRFVDTWGSMLEGTSGDSLGPLYVFGYQPILQMKQLRMSEVTVWASLIAQWVKNPPAIQRHRFDSWVRKICWRRDRLPTPVFLGFLGGSAGKESACNVGNLGSIPELGRSSGEGKGYPLHCCGLENSMDCIVPGVTVSHNSVTFTFVLPHVV